MHSDLGQLCPFCTLPADRIVASNELAVVIRDGFPISRGHTLVIRLYAVSCGTQQSHLAGAGGNG
jgi:diadenosine tetraphosphate (Ap4A) HIT family hydrolase